MTLSVVILPAKVLADGTHKLRIALAHNGQTRYYNTRFTVPSIDCLRNGVVVKVGNASYINQQLRNLQTKLYQAYDNIEDSEYYTCSQLLALIKKGMERSRVRTFKDVSDEWLEFKASKCADSSMKSYRMGVRNFGKFAGDDFMLQTLTAKTLYNYDNWLSSSLKLSGTTINIRINVLRDIITYAVKHKYISFSIDPFEDYKKHPVVIRQCELPVAVLRKLRDAEIPNPDLALTRDMIMLSFYLAGMNGADMFTLDLSNDIISFSRQKTKNRRKNSNPTTFTIQPEARAIINRYIGKDGKVRFGTIDNEFKMSAFVSHTSDRIAKLIDYKGNLIFYSGRKTFSQLANMLGIQENVILYCLGDSYSSHHSNMLSFYTYVDKKMADNAIRKVLDFIASDLTEDDLFIQ